MSPWGRIALRLLRALPALVVATACGSSTRDPLLEGPWRCSGLGPCFCLLGEPKAGTFSDCEAKRGEPMCRRIRDDLGKPACECEGPPDGVTCPPRLGAKYVDDCAPTKYVEPQQLSWSCETTDSVCTCVPSAAPATDGCAPAPCCVLRPNTSAPQGFIADQLCTCYSDDSGSCMARSLFETVVPSCPAPGVPPLPTSFARGWRCENLSPDGVCICAHDAREDPDAASSYCPAGYPCCHMYGEDGCFCDFTTPCTDEVATCPPP